MDDLISRQAAIDALGERPMVWTDSDYEIAQRNQYDMDKLAIETVPSAQTDVVRVVHGRWELVKLWTGFESLYCSKCNHETNIGSNYCPFCGARMDDNG